MSGARHRHVQRRRPTWSWPSLGLLGLVAVLTVVGLVMVLSASSVHSLRVRGSSWYVFERQLVRVLVGVALLALVARVPYWRWQPLALPLLGFSCFLMTLVVATPLGVARNGSKRWLGPASLQIQPSELAKLGLVLSLATLLSSRAHRTGNPRLTLRPALVLTTVVVALVMVQPDMGTTMIVVVTAAGVLLAANIPMVSLARTVLFTGVLALLASVAEPYRRDRMLTFLNPDGDVLGTGFHLRQSLVGLGSGRLFGVGVGASRSKWGFLPNAHTDFIFTIIGEELGLVGSLLILSMFFAMTVLGLVAAQFAPDRFGMLLAVGITSWIIGQAIINIAAVIGVMPITGVPLPFISAGGSSFIVIMAATGVLLNIARHAVIGHSGTPGRHSEKPRQHDDASARHPANPRGTTSDRGRASVSPTPSATAARESVPSRARQPGPRRS